MDLRELLERLPVVAGEYLSTVDARVNAAPNADQLVRVDLADALRERSPAHFEVEGSIGKGRRTHVPWVMIRDPDETESAQEGLYVVLLAHADLQGATLSLNQGVTKLVNENGRSAARAHLTAFAAQLRELEEVATLLDHPRAAAATDLRLRSAEQQRGKAKLFEDGHVAGFEYRVSSLPTADELTADVVQITSVYDSVLGRQADGELERPSTGGTRPKGATRDAPPSSKAKPDGRVKQKRRASETEYDRVHEQVQNDYVAALAETTWSAATNRWPRDIVLEGPPGICLVEVKRVYAGRHSAAVDEVIGQLHRYRWDYHRDEQIEWAAVLTAPIVDSYVDLLDSLGIAVVWPTRNGWAGTTRAAGLGLIP